MDASGRRIRHYRLLGRAGCGAQGVVYKAIDEFTSDLVAIKVMNVATLSSKARESALSEVRVLALLSQSSTTSSAAPVAGSASAAAATVAENFADAGRATASSSGSGAGAQATVARVSGSPHVMRYIDSFVEGDDLCIVLEWVDGGTLQDVLERRRRELGVTSSGGSASSSSAPGVSLLPEECVWHIFISVLLGLAACHRLKVLHRDVKPANIFVASKAYPPASATTTVTSPSASASPGAIGVVEVGGGSSGTAPAAFAWPRCFLGDFGVSTVLDDRSRADTVVGTPYYLSPELCMGRSYDARSDVWALGVLLYYLCNDRMPFEASNYAALILRIVQTKHAPMQRHGAYSADLYALAERCMEKVPEKRPTVAQILAMPVVVAAGARLGLLDEFPSQIRAKYLAALAASASSGSGKRKRAVAETGVGVASASRAGAGARPPLHTTGSRPTQKTDDALFSSSSPRPPTSITSTPGSVFTPASVAFAPSQQQIPPPPPPQMFFAPSAARVAHPLTASAGHGGSSSLHGRHRQIIAARAAQARAATTVYVVPVEGGDAIPVPAAPLTPAAAAPIVQHGSGGVIGGGVRRTGRAGGATGRVTFAAGHGGRGGGAATRQFPGSAPSAALAPPAAVAGGSGSSHSARPDSASASWTSSTRPGSNHRSLRTTAADIASVRDLPMEDESDDATEVGDHEAPSPDSVQGRGKSSLLAMAKKQQQDAIAHTANAAGWGEVDPAQSLHFASHPGVTVFGSTAASALMRGDDQEGEEDLDEDEDAGEGHPSDTLGGLEAQQGRDPLSADPHDVQDDETTHPLSGTVLSAASTLLGGEASTGHTKSKAGTPSKAAAHTTTTTREYSSDAFEASSSTSDEEGEDNRVYSGCGASGSKKHGGDGSSVQHDHDHRMPPFNGDVMEGEDNDNFDGEEVEFIRPGTVGWRVGDECGTSVNSLTASHRQRVGMRSHDDHEDQRRTDGGDADEIEEFSSSSGPELHHRHHAESDNETIVDETRAEEDAEAEVDDEIKYDDASFATTQTATYDDEASIRAQLALVESEGIRACGGDAPRFARVLDAVRSGEGRECAALAPLSDAAAADALYCAFRYVMLASSMNSN